VGEVADPFSNKAALISAGMIEHALAMDGSLNLGKGWRRERGRTNVGSMSLAWPLKDPDEVLDNQID
jgi:hypothetical protein